MAFGAHVQSTTGNLGAGPSVSLAYPSNVAAGNILLVQIRFFDETTIASITDTRGNTYNSIRQVGNTFQGYLFYCPSSISGGANTIFITTNSTTVVRTIIAEYEGPSTFDDSASAIGVGTAMNSGDMTTTVANALLIGAGFNFGNDGFTAGASFTIRQSSEDRAALEERVVTSTGTYPATMTMAASNDWVMIGAAFVAAAVGSSFVRNERGIRGLNRGLNMGMR